MNLFYAIILLAVLYFCLLYVWNLTKSLPQDISHIRMLQSDKSRDIYYGELVSLIGSWLLALILLVVFAVPILWKVLFGWLQIGKVITMLFDAIL